MPQAAITERSPHSPPYKRHRPEQTLLYHITNSKRPTMMGTTHVIFEPLGFIAKLAARVPKPRVNLTRFHGVFGPNSKHKHRRHVTPARRGKGNPSQSEGKTPEQRHQAMAWV
jgi:hypothetical protein